MLFYFLYLVCSDFFLFVSFCFIDVVLSLLYESILVLCLTMASLFHVWSPLTTLRSSILCLCLNCRARVWQCGCGLLNNDVIPTKLNIIMLVEEQISAACVIVTLKMIFQLVLMRNLWWYMFNIQTVEEYENSFKVLNPYVALPSIFVVLFMFVVLFYLLLVFCNCL